MDRVDSLTNLYRKLTDGELCSLYRTTLRRLDEYGIGPDLDYAWEESVAIARVMRGRGIDHERAIDLATEYAR